MSHSVPTVANLQCSRTCQWVLRRLKHYVRIIRLELECDAS